MALKSEIPFVHEDVRQLEGGTRRFQVLTCTVDGCGCTKEFPVNGSGKPSEAIYNMARKAGWSISKKAAKCPDHATARKPSAAPKMPCPGKMEPKQMPLTPDLRRAIFRAIDQHYDEAAQCYRGLITDQHIAAETGAATDDVAAVREENFGPAENRILTEALARLSDAEAKRDQAAAMIADGTNMLRKVNAEIEAITELLTKG